MSGVALRAAVLLVLAAADVAPREMVERFFKALDKRDAAAAGSLLHPEAALWRLGDEKLLAEGSVAFGEYLLARFQEFPKWSVKLGERIAAGSWVAARERAVIEPGEKPRETLFLFQVEKGAIRDAWLLEADAEGGGEGAAALLVEKWNDRDLPRFLALFDTGASLWELPSAQRLASGEEELRELYEKAFEEGPPTQYEVLGRMSLSPWVVYQGRGTMDIGAAPPPAESLAVLQVRGGLVRRVWFAR